MKRFAWPLGLCLMLLSGASLHAQDNVAPRIEEKVRVTGGEKTDVILTRAFMLSSIDSVPYDNARSGTYSIGIGYGIPMGKVLELKFEPRATWHKIYIKPEAEKWFPSAGTDSSLVYEKRRAFYAELPVGLKFKLARNAVDKYQLLIEGGFSAGVNLGGVSKVRRLINTDEDPEFEGKSTVKINRVDELNRLRWGPYVRFGTRYVSLYAFYRMTTIHAPGKKFNVTPTTTRPYPNFPKIEFGFSVTI